MTFAELEQARLIYRKKLSVILWIFGLAMLAVTVLLFPMGFFFAFAVLMVPFIICYIFIPNKSRIAYEKAYKTYFVAQALAKLFPGCHYAHDAGLPRQKVAETNLFDLGDHYSSNDLISGEYKGVDFAQADVKITETRTDSEGHSYTVTIFQGRYMIFEFKKKFDFRLAVVGKSFSATSLRRQKNGRKFNRISLESPMFNKLYRVYAEDGFEAFYLLDPAFLDRAEKLAEAHKKRVFLGFFGNKLHVAIQDGKDSLEPPSPFHKLDEAKEFQRVATDLKLVTDIVDSLKLEA